MHLHSWVRMHMHTHMRPCSLSDDGPHTYACARACIREDACAAALRSLRAYSFTRARIFIHIFMQMQPIHMRTRVRIYMRASCGGDADIRISRHEGVRVCVCACIRITMLAPGYAYPCLCVCACARVNEYALQHGPVKLRSCSAIAMRTAALRMHTCAASTHLRMRTVKVLLSTGVCVCVCLCICVFRCSHRNLRAP
jgi:hypothetical protein